MIKRDRNLNRIGRAIECDLLLLKDAASLNCEPRRLLCFKRALNQNASRFTHSVFRFVWDQLHRFRLSIDAPAGVLTGDPNQAGALMGPSTLICCGDFYFVRTAVTDNVFKVGPSSRIGSELDRCPFNRGIDRLIPAVVTSFPIPLVEGGFGRDIAQWLAVPINRNHTKFGRIT